MAPDDAEDAGEPRDLFQRMHEWGWFRQPTPGDNSCAFHALAQNTLRLRLVWNIMGWDDTVLLQMPTTAVGWRHACVQFIDKYANILDINSVWVESASGWETQVRSCNNALPD